MYILVHPPQSQCCVRQKLGSAASCYLPWYPQSDPTRILMYVCSIVRTPARGLASKAMAASQYLKDLGEEVLEASRLTVARGSGPGGQSVNKTMNAVKVIHEPTGLSVSGATQVRIIQPTAPSELCLPFPVLLACVCDSLGVSPLRTACVASVH